MDWGAFGVWVFRDHREYVARSIVSYAKRYAYCLLSGDLSDVVRLRRTMRPHVLKALSNLAKFLGIHEEFRRLIRNYGLSWKGKSTDELIIDRLTKIQDPNEIFDWVRQVKMKIPSLANFMDLMVVTGMRLVEGITSHNLIISLSKEGKLAEYYNEEKGTLEHFRFKQQFLRKSKKVFISFITREIVEKIKEDVEIPSRFALQKRLERAKLKGRFGDVREAHGTFMTEYLKESEIDFLHGRVSASVFMAYYFNPALITDLKERVFKAIAEIQTKI